MQVERRKKQRFQVKDSGFAVINPDPVKLVPIIDISLGGLGFYDNDHADWPNRSCKLEIMVADCSFYLENLPFKIISSIRLFPDESANLMEGHRYGLEFGNLETNQQSRLEYFIRNYTVGNLTPQFVRTLKNVMYRLRAPRSSAAACHSILHSHQSPIG